MECGFCHKVFASIYNMKIHQTTTKACIKLQQNGNVNGHEIERKTFDCPYCEKKLTTKKNVTSHIKICRFKIIVERDNKKKEQDLKHIEQSINDKTKLIENKLEDELSRIQSEVKSKQEELETELRIKEEKNRKLEERIKELETKYQHPTIINNNNTYNNNLTIYNYMTPERVTEVFDKHFTIETLMGGQKALANFIVDQFVAGEDKMVYLCVDRSRKKCMYTKDFIDFHEDVNNELLLRQLTPAMRVIRDKVGWTEYEKKYNPHLSKIHESYDEILAIPDDGTIFRTQLCKRLPSSVEDKRMMDENRMDQTFTELRNTEEQEFAERKEEIQRVIAKSIEEPKPEPILIPNQICGIGLARLDDCRKLFKNQGIYRIHPALKDQIEANPEVAHSYEDYVKKGMFKGKVIWE